MSAKKQKVATAVTNEVQLMSLDQIQSKKDFEKFNSSSKEEYENKLRRMSESDLSNHAIKMGFRPTGQRRILTLNLLKSFETADRVYSKYRDGGPLKDPAPQIISSRDAYDDFMLKFRK